MAKNEPSAAYVKLERENGDEKMKKDDPVVEDNVKQVVFDVGERAVGIGATRQQPHGHPEGFPSAFKLEGAEQTGPRRKKVSLFKQKMMARCNITYHFHFARPVDISEQIITRSLQRNVVYKKMHCAH